jgi:threonine dehydrogenase-like Zn-dependent dehydrogenase
MRALVWHGTGDIRCDTVPDPRIENDRDPIIKVTGCAICGSDLHFFDHFIPTMKSGDIRAMRRWVRSSKSALR